MSSRGYFTRWYYKVYGLIKIPKTTRRFFNKAKSKLTCKSNLRK